MRVQVPPPAPSLTYFVILLVCITGTGFSSHLTSEDYFIEVYVMPSMSSDGPTPPPCNPDIFQKGQGICVLSGRSNAIENWVKTVAAKANAEVDWHYSGGRANVLHLGDADSRQRVLNAIEELKSELDGYILDVGGPALYRKGDPVPVCAIAASGREFL